MIGQISACTLDCPDSCSLLIVQDAKGDFHIRGNPDHPFTAGYTCKKIRGLLERLKSPHRVTTPLLRSPTGWQPIGWHEALDLCAKKIQECRQEPSSILHYHGEGAKGVLKQVSKLFFAMLGSSEVRGSLCDGAGYLASVADFGSRKGNDIVDILNSRLIVNWGKDLSRSSIHTATLVRKARQQGAEVISISPGGDGNASFSDRLIRIRPGTDRFLAAALIALLIQEGSIGKDLLEHCHNWESFRQIVLNWPLHQLLAHCDVSSGDLEAVFSFYNSGKPVATLIGAGVQRHGYGGENVRFINAAAFLSDNIGRSGRGVYFHLHSLRNVNLDWTKDPAKKPRRSLLMPTIGRDMLAAQNPPIRMIWVDGSNLVNQAPDSHSTARAFEKIDFKVVVDAFMTDTAERADLILPCALMLEQEDVVASYLHDFIHYVTPVFEAPGEAKSDYWILSELGRRLKPPVPLPSPEECFRSSLRWEYLDVSLEELIERRFVRAKQPQIAYEGMRFDHPDGKYRFPSALHEEPPAPSDYPFRLLTLIRRDAIHSQILPEDQEIPPVVWVAPDHRGLDDLNLEREVYLVSPLDRMRVRVETLPGLHPDVILYRRGDWMKLGGGVNQLIESALTDLGRCASYYQQHARLINE